MALKDRIGNRSATRTVVDHVPPMSRCETKDSSMRGRDPMADQVVGVA
jgi:hypothetical protein